MMVALLTLYVIIEIEEDITHQTVLIHPIELELVTYNADIYYHKYEIQEA